jgi:predicted  nucleic acid-binding Zn-ribbon protein
LIKIQQKQTKAIEGSIKEQQGAINILIKNLRKKLVSLARKEEVLVSELSDDAPERETVVNRIISRSKETIGKLDTVMATLKTKKAKLTTEQTDLKTTIKELGEKLVGLQAKIVSG